MHVRRAKNGTPSVHPIRGDEIRALRKLRRENSNELYAFVTERGGPMTGTDQTSLDVRAAGATPPVGGIFGFLKLLMPPLPKACSKTVSALERGEPFCGRHFCKKNFQVREKIPLSALASAAVTRLWPRGIRSRRPHSSLLVVCSGSKTSPSARTRTARPGEAGSWLKSRTRASRKATRLN